mmetsp:Transcript_37723/g.91784  ORF Transcript_37723/g.91784 Transcript_37723/m.91784 type:complete len:150 (+) Transcript_37723:3-452(+)
MLDDKNDTDNLDTDSFLSLFIYVAAGNMVAAGHGNLYNESYTSPDYYDFWLTPAGDGWNHLQFPNKAKRNAYGYKNHKFKGNVVLYPMVQAKDYYGGKKTSVGLAEDDFRQKKWDMKINGQVVTDLIGSPKEEILAVPQHCLLSVRMDH